ncbi:MAG: DegT/DnrJ/EryC1/StrS family aminotransferase [Pyrinomonadaceae bacterium]
MLRSVETIAVPLLDLKEQYASIREEVRAALDLVLDSQHLILGPEVEALEQEIAGYSDCKYGVGLSSGTDALLVALMAIGVKAGDEVITPSYSFFATAGCVARLGARPVFVDSDPQTYNLAVDQIESLITERTRAIIPVHLYGQMAEMDAVMEIARKFNLIVIEDAAQAIGAEYKGRRAGSIGDLGCFSFYPTKNLGGFGDGGMITTNSPELAERVRLLRNHGDGPKYHHKVVGGNFRLDAIQAAVLRVKLKYLDEWTGRRQINAANYRKLFSDSSLKAKSNAAENRVDSFGINLPVEAAERRHIYNQFVIKVSRRDKLRAFLQERQIGTEVYYPVPLHLQECFAELGYKAGELPESEEAASRTLALPIYPELTLQQQEAVVGAIEDFYSQP